MEVQEANAIELRKIDFSATSAFLSQGETLTPLGVPHILDIWGDKIPDNLLSVVNEQKDEQSDDGEFFIPSGANAISIGQPTYVKEGGRDRVAHIIFPIQFYRIG